MIPLYVFTQKTGTIEYVVNFEPKHLVNWLRVNTLSLNESKFKSAELRSEKVGYILQILL